jgi:hypothetical protein
LSEGFVVSATTNPALGATGDALDDPVASADRTRRAPSRTLARGDWRAGAGDAGEGGRARWARVPMFLMFRAVKPAAGSAITPRQGGAPARGQVAGDATLAASDLEGVRPPGAGTSAKDASRSSQ